jgi:uroporphyrinogen decarboxylase
MTMNRRQRLEAAVRGDVVDRVPVAAWGHFYCEETSAEGMANAMLTFQHRYDWDFIKIHARASYHAEGFGFRYEPSRDPAVLHKMLSQVITKPSDWRRLRPLSLDDAALAEQFRAIALIRKAADPDLPLIMTVFSPLDIADTLVGRQDGLLKRHIEEAPDDVEAALAVFAETFAPFVRKLAECGIDGLYFSTKWVNSGKLSSEDYRRLARKHDLTVLAEAGGMWCNIMHLCEDGVHLDAVVDYPVQVVHWDNCMPHNPSLSAGARLVRRSVGGGVSPATLARGTPEDVLSQARRSIADAAGRGLLLSSGCSVQIARTPAANLEALRHAVDAAI